MATTNDRTATLVAKTLEYSLLTLEFLKISLHVSCLVLLAIFRYFVPEPRKSVRSRNVLITGSANGLGRHLALKFSDLGATVILWDVDKKGNLQLLEDIKNRGGQAFAYEVDVSEEKQVEEAGRKVMQEVGHVHYIINNAAVLPGKPLMLLNSYQIRRTLEINTLSHFWIIRQFLPDMLDMGEGHIVAIASIAGVVGCANLTDYCASKHAVFGLMSALREDLYTQGKDDLIQLTIACPPTMRTALVQKPKTRFPSIYAIYEPEDVAELIVDGVLRNKQKITPFPFNIPMILSHLLPIDAVVTAQRFFDYSLEPNVN